MLESTCKIVRLKSTMQVREMQLKLWRIMMNVNCLKLASLVTMIPWHYLELCGTSSPFTLAYEGEMSIESCVSEILLSLLTQKIGASTLSTSLSVVQRPKRVK